MHSCLATPRAFGNQLLRLPFSATSDRILARRGRYVVDPANLVVTRGCR
jgi:hypothetical protein